jgi:uncharacterized protein YegP (UPF0339 family)
MGKPAAVARHELTFRIRRDGLGLWRWQLRKRSGRVVCESKVGYTDVRRARREIEIVRRSHDAKVVEDGA